MATNRIRALLLGLITGLTGASIAHAQDIVELTTVRQVRALTPVQAGRRLPVRIRGVVTVLSGWKSSFFFQDATAGISVDRTNDTPPLIAGLEVEIHGVTGAGLFAPIVLASDVKVLGKGTFPAAPTFDFSELASGRQDSQWIGVHGTVRSANVKQAWGRSVLFLTMDVGRGNLITVRVHDFPASGAEYLVAAQVSVRGVCGTVFNDKRQLVGLRMFVQNLTHVHIETPAPGDPFNGRASPLTSPLQFSNWEGAGAIPRVKVRGTLIYQDVGRGLYLQSGNDGLFVRSEQITKVPLGADLEVVGYPAAGSYSPSLVDAVFRTTGTTSTVPAKSIPASDALVVKDGFLSAPYDSMLVQVSGRLIEHLPGNDEDVLLLQNGGGILTVRLRNLQEGPNFSSLPGSLLRITGVGVAEVDEYHEIQSFEILARSPADIVMLEKASWWTRTHLIWAVALLGFLAIATLGCLVIVHREQRTIQIENTNVELKHEILAREHAQEELQCKTDELARSKTQLEQFAQEELRRSDAMRITALESAQLGDWQIDIQSGLVSRSLLHDRIFGYAEKLPEWSFDIFIDHVYPEDRERVKRIYKKHLGQGKRWDFECRIVWPDQTIHWIWSCGGPYVDQSGKITYMMGTIADITERKQAEASQSHTQKLESLGTLAGGIAHDFNNILMAITGYTALASADLAPDHPVQRSLSEIAKAGGRATDLVRRILTFSRPGELERKSIDLRSVIEEALQLVRATLPATIQFRTAFAPNVPAVLADSSQVHQIIVNLATNAAHAIGAKSDGTIELHLDTVQLTAGAPAPAPNLPAGTYVRLFVRDNGCGMDRTTLERIFDPFFTTKGVGKGTGLGLAVVHGIMKNHNGGVAVLSEPGAGSTFQLFFPAAGSAISTAQEAPSLIVRERTENVLYVDDEEALVILATRTLEHLGYKVTGQTDPVDAIELFRSNPQAYDVVVTDLAMPGLSGFDLSSQVLAIRPDIPIVMTSGYVRPEDQERALNMGLRDLILKPDTVAQLGRTLDRVFCHELR
jgi:PAS domain S-box-containing protein